MAGVDAEDAGDVFDFFVLQILNEAFFPLRRVKLAVVIAFISSLQCVIESFDSISAVFTTTPLADRREFVGRSNLVKIPRVTDSLGLQWLFKICISIQDPINFNFISFS